MNENRVILVTGGSSGLGRTIVEHFASRNNYEVHFTYNSRIDEALYLQQNHNSVFAHKCDFTSKRSVKDLCDLMSELQLDIIVNNAWSSTNQVHFRKETELSLEQYFQNNVLPTLSITKAAIEIFRKKRRGEIISILTAYLFGPAPIGLSNYVASKAYLLAMSKSWAAEHKRSNIAAKCISPVMMDTNFISSLDPRMVDTIRQTMPGKTLLNTLDVALSLEALVDTGMSTSGTNLLMTGGQNVI